ncbi:MAG: DUF2933 domain-containing protein [Pseudomonadota bacterium]
MEWLSQNWVWILFAIAMVAMHMGHGGHGMHGGHGGGDHDDAKPAGRSDNEPAPKQGSGHQH